MIQSSQFRTTRQSTPGAEDNGRSGPRLDLGSRCWVGGERHHASAVYQVPGHEILPGVGAAKSFDERLDHAVGLQSRADDLLVEVGDVLRADKLVHWNPQALLNLVSLHDDLRAQGPQPGHAVDV